MGKGNRNRRMNLQKEAEDRYNHPEKYQKKGKNAKNTRGKNTAQIPTWASVLAFTLVAVIIVGALSLTFINGSGVILRAKTALSTEHFEVNGTMMKYFYYAQYQNTYSTYYNYAVNYLGNADYISYFGWTLNENFDHADEKNNTCKLGTVKKDEDGKEMKDANGNKIYDSKAMELRGGSVFTWWDYFMDLALGEVQDILIFCEAAYAEGYTTLESLNPDAKSEIDDMIKTLRSNASSSGFSLGGYLGQLYGSGVTEKDVRKAMELTYIAAEYAELKEGEFEDAITDEDVNKQYEENELDYLFADALTFEYSVDFDHILEGYIQDLDEEYTTEEYNEQVKKAELEYTTRLAHIREMAPKFAETKGNEELFRNLILEIHAYQYFFQTLNDKDNDPDVKETVAEAMKLVKEAKEPIKADSKDTIAKRVASFVYDEIEYLLYEDMPYKDSVSGNWVFKAIGQEAGNVLVQIVETDGTETVFMYPELEIPADEEEDSEDEEGDHDHEEDTSDDTTDDTTDDKEDEKDDGKLKSEYAGEVYEHNAFYVIETAERDDYKALDFGFIILEDHKHSEDEELDDDHIEAEFQAEDYLTQFLASGNLTKEGFEKFVKDNEVANYNTLENCVKGEFGYEEMDEWLFGETNRVGTGDVVEIYGENVEPLYYVMVYVFGEGDAAWFVSAKGDILDERYEAWNEEVEKAHSGSINITVGTLKEIG